MLLEPVKFLQKEQFVLLYYRLLPVEGVHIGDFIEWIPRLNIVNLTLRFPQLACMEPVLFPFS